MVRIKICGLTNIKDAQQAAELGADALGFIFYRGSRRWASLDTVKGIVAALPPFITTIGVFVNEKAEFIRIAMEYCSLDIIQLHGNESAEFCNLFSKKVIKAIKVKDEQSLQLLPEYQVEAFLLDTYVEGKEGGSGETFDWRLALKAKGHGRVILSGGLTVDNVLAGIKMVQPYAVDVCTGVESAPGQKDYQKMKRLIQTVRMTET